jgi:hypothetical protein
VDDMDVFGGVDVVKVLSRIVGGRSMFGTSGRSDDFVGKVRRASSPAGSLSLSHGSDTQRFRR